MPSQKRMQGARRKTLNASRLRPSHTTVHTGPYTAVRQIGGARPDHSIIGTLALFGISLRSEFCDERGAEQNRQYHLYQDIHDVEVRFAGRERCEGNAHR